MSSMTQWSKMSDDRDRDQVWGEAKEEPQDVDKQEAPRVALELRDVRESLDNLQATMVPKALINDMVGGLKMLQEQVAHQQEERTQLLADLQDARRDQVALLLTPGMKRLMALFALLRDAQEAGDATGEFEHAAELLLDAIEAFGFEEVPAEEGSTFDKKLHNSVGVEATDNPDLDGTIQRLVSPGFIYSNAKRATFPARVVVHKYAM